MITSEEIKRRLWDGANELRGSMDASRYKDYMLGLMFYKFLSDKTLETFKTLADTSNMSQKELTKEYVKAREDMGQELDKTIQDILGYYVSPKYLYQSWLNDISSGNFEVQKVMDSLNNFERSIAGTKGSDDFKGLFSSSNLDLTNTALGADLNARSKNIKALILLFADLNMVNLQKGDILGDAYEYLIGQFAMESGKKAGEFYTPRQVSEVMAQIVAKTSDIESIYDPTVGSGSLLLTVKKHLDEDTQKMLSYYGQEKNTSTYNLTRMNLLLHGVRPEKMIIKNGDTLSKDWPEDPERPNEGVLFDAVVMNPPYSAKNWNEEGLKVSDPRFQAFGTLPPESKGDFAFLLHGLYHLGQNGAMAIVLPHGVLFRGSAEGDIRQKLLEKNYIDTIIGLPSNLFTNTGIPVVVIVLKKNRTLGDPALIIDASNNFIKVGKQNVLQEKDIAKIVDTYIERTEEKGYSHLATREEIIENGYNLNIPRYVESIDEEIPEDVDAHLYGGIPMKNLSDLEILREETSEILHNAVKEIRTGYVELTKSVDEISEEVLNHSAIKEKLKIVGDKTKKYIDKYYKKLKNLDKNSDLKAFRENMLVEIKTVLWEFKHVDIYDGYQIIAEIWQNALISDTEIIANTGFYNAGRDRLPNMITKGAGAKKHEQQDGWIGAIIPNDLIAKNLYADELKDIEDNKNRLSEIESELSEMLEAAKVEGSEEERALSDSLNENGDAFDTKMYKAELKKAEKSTVEYQLLKKVEKLFNEKSSINKSIKVKEKELKEAVQERIISLTDEEIDMLMYKKWFGNTLNLIASLVETPIKKELDKLEMLNERYKDTLSSIDEKSRELEKDFENLVSQLTVCN